MRLRLYGRAYCHLCEEMARALEPMQEALRFSVEVFDVDTDPALEARYGERVPVLTDETGAEICHFRLDETALRAVLATAPGETGAMR